MKPYARTMLDETTGRLQLTFAGFLLLNALAPFLVPMMDGHFDSYCLQLTVGAAVLALSAGALFSGRRLAVAVCACVALADGALSVHVENAPLLVIVFAIPSGSYMLARAFGLFRGEV